MQKPEDILKQYWGYNSFRANQDKIINSVLNGNDTLALLPTGGGKSVCFQVPALMLNGLCIVVSPLIALMKDQVENLRKKDITAYAIYAGLGYREVQTIINNCINGAVKFLYLSPERLVGSTIREQLGLMPVNLIAVDEAHCISQWGYDFRPEYRQILLVRELFDNVNILALTASATKQVAEDIQQQLGFKKYNVFKNSFERKNLHYIVRHTEQKFDKIIEALNKIKGSGLIYVRSRNKTEEIARQLNMLGIKAACYHAGMDFKTRQQKQDSWINNQQRILVCTNAFGMGIDKPDCYLVIHYEIPDSIEAYYQEAGRAGRNNKNAYCLMLFNKADEIALDERVNANFPPETEIRKIYNALCSNYQVAIGNQTNRSLDFNIDDFCVKYKLNKQQVYASVKILQQLELVYVNDYFYEPAKLKITTTHEDLYRLQVENEKIDTIIKMLLRTYGGMFDNYVSINEKFIATKLKTDEDSIKNMLIKLSAREILDYIPQKEKPQITFTSERVDAGYINFEKTLLRKRKELYLEKLNAVKKFANQHNTCRSRFLLLYFNEANTIDCGKCDVCVERKKTMPGNIKLQELKEILKVLCAEPKSLQQLFSDCKNYKKEELTFMLRIFVDENLLIYHANQFTWNYNKV